MLKERENVIVSAVEPTGANREKIWVQHSNNIVDKSLAIDNRYVWLNNNVEAISSNNNYWSTGRLQVKPNTTYYFDKNINYIVYYNNSGTAVRMETDKSSFITGSNEYYVQLSFAKSKVAYNSDIMISTIENASYEPYVASKMYVLNDNNVYEEFIQKENKKYSTEEQRIGTFLGKPLYKKTLNLNTPSTTSNTVVGNFDSTFIVRHYYGDINVAASNQLLPINFYFTEEYNITTYVTNSKGDINMKVGSASYINQAATITLEYTKTTD